MLHDLTKRLIDRVHAQTERGEVDWSEASEKNAYMFEADGFQVTVEATGGSVTLTIADADGRELETLTDDDLSAAAAPNGEDYETIVRAMHTRARRVALGTDDAIERILKALDGPPRGANW